MPEGAPAPPLPASVYAESGKRAAPRPVRLSAAAAGGACLLPRPSHRGNPSAAADMVTAPGPLEAGGADGAAHQQQSQNEAPVSSTGKGTIADNSLPPSAPNTFLVEMMVLKKMSLFEPKNL